MEKSYYEEIIGELASELFKGEILLDAFILLTAIIGATFFLFAIYKLLLAFTTFIIYLIKAKLTAKRLGIKRIDQQSYIGSIPLRDCPCCGTPPRAELVYQRFKVGSIFSKIGYIYCPGCHIKTDNDCSLDKAAMIWNRRPHQVDCLGEGDYKQIFEIDQKYRP